MSIAWPSTKSLVLRKIVIATSSSERLGVLLYTLGADLADGVLAVQHAPDPGVHRTVRRVHDVPRPGGEVLVDGDHLEVQLVRGPRFFLRRVLVALHAQISHVMSCRLRQATTTGENSKHVAIGHVYLLLSKKKETCETNAFEGLGNGRRGDDNIAEPNSKAS